MGFGKGDFHALGRELGIETSDECLPCKDAVWVDDVIRIHVACTGIKQADHNEVVVCILRVLWQDFSLH